MTGKCLCYTLGEKVNSGSLGLQKLDNWEIEVVQDVLTRDKADPVREQYELWRCSRCSTYWEWRPATEEGMYGGVPGEWVRVSEEYVKKNYRKE